MSAYQIQYPTGADLEFERGGWQMKSGVGTKDGLGEEEFVPAVMHGCKAAMRGRVQEGDVPPPVRSTEVHF